MIGVGIIGYGYWGPNLLRNFNEFRGSRVIAVSDLKSSRLAVAKKACPFIKRTKNFLELIYDKQVSAVAVATPVSTHYELGMLALKAGKHLLMEKPLALSTKQCLALIREAKKRKLVLLVDHTLIYTGAVQKIRELIKKGTLGKIYYYDSVRVNFGLFQDDVSVIWDLAVHDLSIMDYLLGKTPCMVSATGVKNIPGKPENIAYLTLYFKDKLISHTHVNWLAPVKIRRTLIGGSRKMVVYDDLEPDEKIKLYDRGIAAFSNSEIRHKMLVGYRTGDMLSPKLDTTEALRSEVEHFIDCIKNKKTPITDGESGLRVVKILEAAAISIKRQGCPVKIN
jgi:predicted dehydrogenase